MSTDRAGRRRAPRLGPDTSIAPHLDRGRGRFKRIDPLERRPLPSMAKMLGALGWAVLLVESLRRAWRASKEEQDLT